MKLTEMSSITSRLLYNTTIQRCEKEYVGEDTKKIKQLRYKINDDEDISDNVKISNKLLYFVDFKEIYEEVVSLIEQADGVEDVTVILFVVKRDDTVYVCNVTASLNAGCPLEEVDKQFIEGTLKLYICESLFPGDKTVCKDIVENITK